MAGIIVDSVRKVYRLPDGGERRALNDIDFTVQDGEFVCLLGPSGCGKTTLLNILSGLDADYQGSIVFTGGRASGTGGGSDGNGPQRPVFSYMFQESRLLPWLTVRQNLAFVLGGRRGGRQVGRQDRRRAGSQVGSDGGRDRPSERARVIDEWLERVGLADFGHYFPAQLSVGMQQRVSLARALIVEPEVLFMDEPLSSLDELTASQMREILLDLWAEQGATVVFVTHNPVEAVYLADRVLIMSAGPGEVVHDLNVGRHLPRPRDSEDGRVWDLSRECVRILKGKGRLPKTDSVGG